MPSPSAYSHRASYCESFQRPKRRTQLIYAPTIPEGSGGLLCPNTLIQQNTPIVLRAAF